MSTPHETPVGDPAREAIDSLRGYVYQIYQSALAWADIKDDEFLYLEVAEDFAVAAKNALEAVQVKDTAKQVTINSDDIIASIDSYIVLQEKNPSLNVSLRHLTTSNIGKEQKNDHRIGSTPTLISWRNLAKTGELSDLRRILENSKLSKKSKNFIALLDDAQLREKLLRKIHFDCGALDTQFLTRRLNSRISELLRERGGAHSQAEGCIASMMLSLLRTSTNSNRNDRRLDKSGLEVHLEAVTKVTLDRRTFEQLMERALSASMPVGSHLASSRSIKPSPVSAVPLPNALANRDKYLKQLSQSLESFGVCWISGAAGMGKTVTSRMIAHQNGDEWGSLNFRGQLGEQVASTLSEIANVMPSFDLQGLIIDDLDCPLETSVLDNLNYLIHSANHSDVLIVITSARQPNSNFLFTSNLRIEINTTLTEFTKKDIEEILEKMNVEGKHWAQYTHLVSGGGHPQLAIAFIQSMVTSGWNLDEFKTFNSLIGSSSPVSEVRTRTRERLLRDLPESARRLIERLSLKVGGFERELVIDLGKITPSIQDAGIILDSLVGSWIDQHEGDRFNLSPLLSGFANSTSTEEEKTIIHSAIADSLTKGSKLNLIDMNAALWAAWSSKNTWAITKLCMGVFFADADKLEILASHLLTFNLIQTDMIAYPDNPAISHMFRGAQLILINQSSDSSVKLENTLHCFYEEAGNVQDEVFSSLMNLLVYSKLLIQNSKSGLSVSFIGIIQKLDQSLKNHNHVLPPEALDGFRQFEADGLIPISFMFLNQVRQLSSIDELPIVFDFLDSSRPELRSKLLSAFNRDDFEVDILVRGAWLSEDKKKTINPLAHSAIFASLEKQAASWNQNELAICCRKYHVVILDEYGNDKESALNVLNGGFEIYGQTSYELVRAKAKVLYHSGDHKESLALSKGLIESDAPLNDIEKAFLGRDAAISAEQQRDFETARQFYLYGSEAANKIEGADMAAMRVGLLADAALASWHNGDRATCLKGFIVVLEHLNQFKPSETLRTAHCHALIRHALLWLDQNASGEMRPLENGEVPVIHPGCVSNPEPHPEIGERKFTSIEIAWYQLAQIEGHASLDLNIIENLEQFLPSGPVREGQAMLMSAKMHKAMNRIDAKLFISALKDTISCYAFARGSEEGFGGFDVQNVTYGTFPIATEAQQEQLREPTEMFVLLYFAMCILKNDIFSISNSIQKLAISSGFSVRSVIFERLQKSGPVDDLKANFALLIWAHASNFSRATPLYPRQVFELAFNILHTAKNVGHFKLFSESLLPWLKQKWGFIWQHQHSLLSHPSLHVAAIETALGKKDIADHIKSGELLLAILPALEISNHRELEQTLRGLLN